MGAARPRGVAGAVVVPLGIAVCEEGRSGRRWLAASLLLVVHFFLYSRLFNLNPRIDVPRAPSEGL